ncbi:putative dehydrogenase [Rhodoblastus sphagnicola]|nr:Gfo/Idh/MocA family oxidoreductase [Rhodoblastus sphagnicola]MBB4200283.1 putative dehydrogenase [Rhodoblastus sphagnicola]
MMDGLRKFWRFVTIYGPRRALFKAAGRLRGGRAWWLGARRGVARDIGVIGCGQFAFASIGYAIATRFGLRFGAAFDPDRRAVASFASFFQAEACDSADEVIGAAGVRVVYIASNHASHADYAIAALAAGHDVYCEKPLAVTQESFAALMAARARARGRLFAGYNRPFSAAIAELRAHCRDIHGPLTLACIVQGHVLGPDHWYRRPEEGTRICGNVGHWLDLMVHVRAWNGLPTRWRIDCAWSDDRVRDDDLTVTLTSAAGDLVTITLTARAEPFEGIAETIVLQWGEIAATIDDFRAMTLHVGKRRIRRRYWPKDVGHVAALLQPFRHDARDFREVELSTRLMLAITDMVRSGTRSRLFDF